MHKAIRMCWYNPLYMRFSQLVPQKNQLVELVLLGTKETELGTADYINTQLLFCIY